MQLQYATVDEVAATWLPIVRALRAGHCNFPIPEGWDGTIVSRLQQYAPGTLVEYDGGKLFSH